MEEDHRTCLLSVIRSRINSIINSMVPDRGIRLHDYFSRPGNLEEVIFRVRYTPYYFHISYSLFIFYIMFITFLWRLLGPLSIAVFSVSVSLWLAMGYWRSTDPMELINCNIKCHWFLALIWIVLLHFLFCYGFWLNVLLSILIGTPIVATHAAFRRDEDLYQIAGDLQVFMRDIIQPRTYH